MTEEAPLKLTRVHMHFQSSPVNDIELTVRNELNKASGPDRGKRIAVAVGSRGVRNIQQIVRFTLDWLLERDIEAFIVPAMGSHGGATADGQRDVLESYGITEESMGVPIRSTMETVRIGAAGKLPLFMDRFAWESDGVILINRVKPHTDFSGFPESGLLKMSVIGLGNQNQAEAVHSYGIEGLRSQLLPAARAVLGTGKIVGGLAIVEDGYDQTSTIQWLPADQIESREETLLEAARAMMPRLPAEKIDLLIVDRIGKDKSGTGMDTKVIGRIRISGQDEPSSPSIKSILALGLTPESHGNAIGVGLADVVTKDLADEIDFDAMYQNGITSTFAERTKLPTVAATHGEAFRIGLRFAGLGPSADEAADNARVVRIRDTLTLGVVYVSENLVREIGDSGLTTVTEETVELLDERGRFTELSYD